LGNEMKPNTMKAQQQDRKFEQEMAKLFKVKKPTVKETPKPTPKRKQGKANKN
jgi:hypothetical protein